MDKYNVYAIVGNRPIAKQNERPLPKDKAEKLAERLEKGKTQARRVFGGAGVSCYYPEWVCNGRVRVVGPGKRTEVDFLTSAHVAERIAFRKNLDLSATEQRFLTSLGKMVMPASVYLEQLAAQRNKSKSAAPPRVRL